MTRVSTSLDSGWLSLAGIPSSHEHGTYLDAAIDAVLSVLLMENVMLPLASRGLGLQSVKVGLKCTLAYAVIYVPKSDPEYESGLITSEFESMIQTVIVNVPNQG